MRTQFYEICLVVDLSADINLAVMRRLKDLYFDGRRALKKLCEWTPIESLCEQDQLAIAAVCGVPLVWTAVPQRLVYISPDSDYRFEHEFDRLTVFFSKEYRTFSHAQMLAMHERTAIVAPRQLDCLIYSSLRHRLLVKTSPQRNALSP